MKTVGKHGKTVDEFYLLHQWRNGWDAGAFKTDPKLRSAQVSRVWRMNKLERQQRYQLWEAVIQRERVVQIYETGQRYNTAVSDLQERFNARDAAILQSKRIIGCTTTAAAKYMDALHAAAPDVLLVEEAGEILEAHVLTALSKNTRQMILIGDHQ